MPNARQSKVLFATFDVVPDPTGTSARTSEILGGLTPYFEVDVLTAKTPEHSHIERYQGARLLRVPVGSGDVRSRAEAFDRAVRRQIQSEEYDLVHFTDPFGGYGLCELKHGLGYRLVYEVRSFPSVELPYTDPDLETDRRLLTRLRRQEIFCLMNADVVLAPSEVARRTIESLGVPPSKVRLVGPPVDLGAFANEAPPTGDPCRLVYVGSHVSWQGLPSLLFALRVAAKQASLSCRIIGPTHGSWQRQLQDMVREFELREVVRIEVPIPHEDIPLVLAESDVGVAPLQKGERNQGQGTVPMKIVEYMAAGRPVIAADLDITRELVADGGTGLLYPPTDEDALAAHIVALAGDPERRARMGAAAREVAKARFDAESARSLVLRIYHELLSTSIEVGAEAFDAEAPSASDEPTITGRGKGRPEEVTQLAAPLASPDDDTASRGIPEGPAPAPDPEGPTRAVDLSQLPGSDDDTGEVRAPGGDTGEVRAPGGDTGEVRVADGDTGEVRAPGGEALAVRGTEDVTGEVPGPAADTGEVRAADAVTGEVPAPEPAATESVDDDAAQDAIGAPAAPGEDWPGDAEAKAPEGDEAAEAEAAPAGEGEEAEVEAAPPDPAGAVLPAGPGADPTPAPTPAPGRRPDEDTSPGFKG